MSLLHVGDFVKVSGKKGIGTVLSTRTFVEELRLLDDMEATIFIANIKQRYGNEYESEWQNVYVSFGRTIKWYEKRELVKHESFKKT